MSEQNFIRDSAISIAFLCVILTSIAVAAQVRPSTAQRVKVRDTQLSTSISWAGQPGISRYRLQVARDQEFTDIIFDQAVIGHSYSLASLPAGTYYWRVAPAAGETGRYSAPARLEIGKPVAVRTPVPVRQPILRPPLNTGWRAATGAIQEPLAAELRNGAGPDLIGVNDDGMVYALDGSSGVAQWTARYRPHARRGEPTGTGGRTVVMTPVVVGGQPSASVGVVVACEGGVRELDGATGRELWRQTLEGRPVAGVLIPQSTQGPRELVLVTENKPALVTIASDTGRIIKTAELGSNVIGAPALYSVKTTRGILLSLDGGIVQLYDAGLDRLRAIKIDTRITTGPLQLQGAHGPLIVIGTESGLIAFDAVDLKPIGRVATDNDAPSGTLEAVDLDGDGSSEIIMLTRRGRLVVINTRDGKIRWHAEGVNGAMAACFADLNGDGTLDVIAAGSPDFAVGYSGRDGEIIWRADDAVRSSAAAAPVSRALVTTSVGHGGSALLVGSDPSGMGLRAVGLPPGAVKTARR